MRSKDELDARRETYPSQTASCLYTQMQRSEVWCLLQPAGPRTGEAVTSEGPQQADFLTIRTSV